MDFGFLTWPAVGDFIYEEKLFFYRLNSDAEGTWKAAGEWKVGQKIAVERVDETGIVASDFRGVENSNAIRELDIWVDEADVRAIVGGTLPITIAPDANN